MNAENDLLPITETMYAAGLILGGELNGLLICSVWVYYIDQLFIACASLHYLVNVFEATQLNYLQLSRKDSYTHRIYSTKTQEQRLSDAVHFTETSYCYVTAQARRCKSKTLRTAMY
jgi:hypothetical protein